jgi:hypothetical protein
MRGIRRTGLCLVAVLACSAMAAATSTAAEYEIEGLPEFGRCVPSPSKTGEYKNAGCTQVSPGKGGYHWLPGPGELNKFEGTSSLTKLETVGKYAVACSSGSYLGEYKTPKTVSLSIGLVGCLEKGTGRKCQSTPAKEAEIETTVEGELGFIKGGSLPKVGLDLKPSAPIVFTCGLPPELPTEITTLTLEGSAIGVIRPPNRMRTIHKLVYTAAAGIQNPEKFEEGLKDTLTLNRLTGISSVSEQAGLTIIDVEEIPKPLIITNEEPIEIKAKP